MKYEKQINKAIKKISKKHGLTYGQIAIKLGMSNSGVNNWVYRNHMPMDSILKVCEVFDMEIMDFLKPEEGKKKIDVVRCKDCKYIGKVGDLIVCRIHEISTRADDYCSRGERSEE